MSIQDYQLNYLKVRVETASPGELTLILYEEFCKKLMISKNLLSKGLVDEMRIQVFKAKDILNELIITLNMDYDISKNLYELYWYYNNRLANFLISKDVAILDEVLEFGQSMVDTWKLAIQSLKPGDSL
ncbi:MULTISPECIES: flagellar export chaperone FliS [Paenibacillus]|jgi:flagellar protein FliS|uniref:flagellar export chaperone FliS n=1 Tax=Paenibacillus TaxID=44249 RepID=UPI0010E2E491|nr:MULTISPECIES: flagellar export chaperone FliS [Paenibacillus]MCI1774335.1 flagellar export chaperone FliS [Paenibacillus lautus]VTR39415.1 Flagellar protein fliS [Actinobacillus pleuropneumoniae]